jgi:hypothetical protein
VLGQGPDLGGVGVGVVVCESSVLGRKQA